ncbi:hypothetical protein [Nonomuraea phyllanthi]|uniref:hypothetical protein n=1 Tax=Nonomuraea phyllanthi TaxID=2219224 RepID=UPI00188597AD|nr:hypothetical protein [Nonomuraea phyllanthi]
MASRQAGVVRDCKLAWEARLRDLTILERAVNGQPGLIARQDGVTVSVCAFEVAGDRITRVWAVRNRDKLRHWTAG